MKNITAIFDKIEPMMDRKNISGIVAVIDGDVVGTDICGDKDEILVLIHVLMEVLIAQCGEDAIVSAVLTGFSHANVDLDKLTFKAKLVKASAEREN